MKKICLLIALLFLFEGLALCQPKSKPENSIYSEELGLSFYPDYPPTIGEPVTLRIKTFSPAQKVTLYSDREKEIPLSYREGHWWAKWVVPADYKEGGHFLIVWIKYPFAPPVKKPSLFANWLKFAGYQEKPSAWWSKSVAWYQAVKKKEATKEAAAEIWPKEITFEVEPLVLPSTGEAVEIALPTFEAPAILIKGSQTIAFTSRRLEGSREGYTPGITQGREETLRINVAGKSSGTDIEANLYRTSASGVSQVGEAQDKVSILLRRGSLEAYLGDFTADLTETEFGKLDKVLSGGRVKGDYDKWGFALLSSSPKGGAKFVKKYGDGTQGPYGLDAPADIVVDSERVYVDGALQKRGDDYGVDHRARTVSFLKKVIDRKSVLQIYYDYRETVYPHSTWGGRIFAKPFPNLKIGATYLNDSDSLSGAESIYSSTGVAPSGHYLLGGDLTLVSENLTLDSELAYTNKNLNLLGSSIEAGRAGKINLTGQLGPWGASARYKKVGAKFQAIADPLPKQDILDYGYGLSFRPSSLFGVQGNQAYEKYTQSDVAYENTYQATRALLSPERLPSLEHNYFQLEESNDPVTGGNIRRTITKNSAETNYQLGFLSASLKGITEKWLKKTPSEEATNYLKINAGLSTVGLGKFSLASNAEYEKREEPAGLKPSRKTYNINLSAAPSKQYFASGGLQVVDDSSLGKSQVVDLSYQLEPVDIFKTEGKYSITSVKEDFPAPGTAEAVSKQAGSLAFDLRPTRHLRFRYLYKPNFTQVLRTSSLSYNNEQQQTEVNIVPVKEALLGLIYRLNRAYNIDKADYPNYSRKRDTTDSDSALYTIKAAPIPMLSTEFNYLLENTSTLTLASTVEPLTYTKGTSRGRKFEILAKTPLTAKLSLDGRYSYQKTDQGTGELSSNLADASAQTASLKAILNVTEVFALTSQGSFTQNTNYLAAGSQQTYTYAPGAGFIYRDGEKLRVDFDYVYSKSFSGADTEKSTYSLKAKYGLSDYVNVTLRYDHEASTAPDYRLTDFSGNIEVNL